MAPADVAGRQLAPNVAGPAGTSPVIDAAAFFLEEDPPGRTRDSPEDLTCECRAGSPSLRVSRVGLPCASSYLM